MLSTSPGSALRPGGSRRCRAFSGRCPRTAAWASWLSSISRQISKAIWQSCSRRTRRCPWRPPLMASAVEPNHVYLIPPGKCLKIFHGKLLLSDPAPAHGSTLVVDQFFCSLAEDQGERAIAIALSGHRKRRHTGHPRSQGSRRHGDGTKRGVREIPWDAAQRD